MNAVFSSLLALFLSFSFSFLQYVSILSIRALALSYDSIQCIQ